MNWGKCKNWGKCEIGLRLCELGIVLILEMLRLHEKCEYWTNFGKVPNMPNLPKLLN